MIVLVTGSSGFIGTHLKHELRSAGHRVIGFDRRPPDTRYAVGGRTRIGDITKEGDFSGCVRRYKPDAVVHLAAQVGREFGEDDIARTIRWNATGTALVAKACGENGVPVLYTSTSEVYGDPGQSEVHEESPMRLPHNLYGLSKRWGEEVLELYAPNELKIARLSMPYGPGAPPGRGRRAMDNFLWQAHHRMPIPVHDGATRSWCHVSDTVRALRLILEGDLTGAWNVGYDGDERPLLQIAFMACEIAGADPDRLIEVVPPPAMQTVVKRLSTERLETDFGWSPTVRLEDGMREVYEWVCNFDRHGNWVGS